MRRVKPNRTVKLAIDCRPRKRRDVLNYKMSYYYDFVFDSFFRYGPRQRFCRQRFTRIFSSVISSYINKLLSTESLTRSIPEETMGYKMHTCRGSLHQYLILTVPDHRRNQYQETNIRLFNRTDKILVCNVT